MGVGGTEGPRRWQHRVRTLGCRAALALLAALAASGCDRGVPGILTDCEAADGVTPICGFRNPEDIAMLPGGTWLAVSQFAGTQGGGGGSLVAFRPADGRKLPLFPDPYADDDAAPDEGGEPDASWGAPDCPGPPDPERFSPHGIDISRRSHRLAVVNHGEREAVELFEIGHSRRGVVAVWRGCVPMPEAVWANDVALLPDGGFLVTHMLSRSGVGQVLSFLRMLLGWNTGRVFEWHAATGLRALPNSEGSAPNGIAVSDDGRQVYFAEWAGRRLVALRRDASGAVVERRSVTLEHHPDNITWTSNGELLVTGQAGPLGEVLACGSVETGTCALPFSVVEVGSGTLDRRVVLDHPGTAHGAGTVALAVGDEIFIGTFAGDRIGRAAFRR